MSRRGIKWIKSKGQKIAILVGLEPTIAGSVGRCLIHWATGPLAEDKVLMFCWFFQSRSVYKESNIKTHFATVPRVNYRGFFFTSPNRLLVLSYLYLYFSPGTLFYQRHQRSTMVFQQRGHLHISGLEKGKFFVIEQPDPASSWNTHAASWLASQTQTVLVSFDQCMTGLQVSQEGLSKKRTAFLTNHMGIAHLSNVTGSTLMFL